MNIPLPAELLQTAQMSESELLQEIAVMLYQKHRIRLDQAAQMTNTSVDDFYQLLIDRNIVEPPTDPDDDPDELILASLRISLQQAQAGDVHPISELWDGIDD
jgi:predicted HTH domain antitoxin